MRGRPRSSKNPFITSLRCDKFLIDICTALEWQISDIFREGFDRRIDRLLSGTRLAGEVPISFLSPCQIDELIEYTENTIGFLKVRVLALNNLKESVETARPKVDKKRELAQRFSELSSKHIPLEEATAYLGAYKARIDRGLPPDPVVENVLSDLQTRTRGADSTISAVMKAADHHWRETLVWNVLIDLTTRNQSTEVSTEEHWAVTIRQEGPTPGHPLVEE